jgi:hypothetical protein
MNSIQTTDEYSTVSDADDYSSLRQYYVATPMAPPDLALRVTKGQMPYFNHNATNLNVYVPTIQGNYDDLTGMGIGDYDKAYNKLQRQPQPVSNITPTPYGNNLNYNWFTEARFGFGTRA